MLIDSRFAPLKAVEKDVCIIGAGPAGISLARDLIGRPLEVALIESGGFDFDPVIQSLADGPTHGNIRPSVEANRRQFGGNSNLWNIEVGPGERGLRHALLEEIDFVKRDWIPDSGWPFGRELLMPYYQRAQLVCHAGPFAYSPEDWERGEIRRLPLEKSGLETGMFQFSPASVFYSHYRNELIAARNVTVHTHASAIELIANDSRKAVTRIRVAQPNGQHLFVSARVFILAAGGFENARLLLMSNRQQSVGLGNDHDVVGRYYHDHPQGRSGYFTPADPQLFSRAALYDLRQGEGTAAMGYLRLSRAMMEKEKLLNINCFLFPKPSRRQDQAIESVNALRSRASGSGRTGKPVSVPRQEWATHLPNVLRGLDYVARMAYLGKTHQQSSSYGLGRGGWSLLRDVPSRFQRFEVWHSMEQPPRADNRVVLGRERDMFGCPRLEVHWKWQQEDIARTLRAQAVVATELERAGLGVLELDDDREEVARTGRHGSHHLMGTTRMHEDPKQGVVDADCRVHGLGNLFIAGSSTFPTGGYANPTLTIVAMALRLGDLVKQELAATTPSVHSAHQEILPGLGLLPPATAQAP